MSAYAELAVTTNFSFLRGASGAEELVAQAKLLGLAALGVADRNTVAGVVRAHMAAKQVGLRVIVGTRLVFADDTPDILAYPRDRAAWGRLTRLLSVGKSRAEKGECTLYLDDLLEYREGFNLIVMPASSSHRFAEEAEKLAHLLARLKIATAPRSVWLAASLLYRGNDHRRLARLADIAARAGVPLIAVNDVLYHAPQQRALQDMLTCIREHVTLDAAGKMLEANAERHLKSAAEMTRLFRAAPQAIAETLAFIERCRFSLDELKYEYPHETREGFATPQDALVAFVEDGARRRYPNGMSTKVRRALNHELTITAELKYAPYFLTVHDIVRFARSKGILCQGRGSAANSVICYCLGITEVDPERIDLLFERFVSAERREPPDIDVDFEHERREEVIQYIYRKYSRERAGLAATVICYRGRSAIREVGKVFGLSDDTVGALASSLWGWSMDGLSEKEARRAGFDTCDPRLRQVMTLAQELMGFPRHLSQHVGGFVITHSRLDEVVPIENAAMEDRTVIEWDKDDLNDLGILKVDILGLGMLSCLRRAFDLLKENYADARSVSPSRPALSRSSTSLNLLTFDGVDSRHNAGHDGSGCNEDNHLQPPLSLADIPPDDPAVYRMLARADSVGVFQVESRAQMSMLPRLRPAEFYDLVIEVAIVRPGPIQGDMVHPYLQRRERLRETGEEPDYPSPAPEHGDRNELRDVLKKTLGVPLFQEQAMRIAIVAAGFAPAEADRLRRAMATFKRVGTIDTFRDKFIRGMTGRGYARDFAERCFSQIEGFGEYGFPESHAASFALLVYASAWIKCRYPDVFAAALLNSQPMGFYAPAQIVRDAQEHGVTVLPADVNFSDWDCTLEGDGSAPEYICARVHQRHADQRRDIHASHAVRLGLRQISGLSEAHARVIESVRGRGFDSVRDLWLRTRLPPAVIERLAQADAFRSLGLDRRDALWAVRALRRSGDKDDLPLFAHAAMSECEPEVDLPPMLPGEEVIEDYRHLKLSLKAHPLSFLRGELSRRGIVANERLAGIPPGRRVSAAGIVLVRQRPGNARAIFMTLEDETGVANAIVWLRTFETFRPVVMGARLVRIAGQLQNESGVIHIIAEHFEDLTPLLQRLSEQGAEIDALARCDEVKRPNPGIRSSKHTHPRQGDSLVRALRQKSQLMENVQAAHAAMPRGRNFH
jgi:error-prone DNA polymerase